MGNEFIFSDFFSTEGISMKYTGSTRKTKILEEDPFLQKNISDREYPLYFHVHFSLVGP